MHQRQTNYKNNLQFDNLHSLIRTQIVQNYPHHNTPNSLIFNNETIKNRKNELAVMQDSEIVEDYVEEHGNCNNQKNYTEKIEVEYEMKDYLEKCRSMSSEQNILKNSRENSVQRLPFFMKKSSEQFMDIEDKVSEKSNKQKPIYNTYVSLIKPKQAKETNIKIAKIQQIGCNCRKSKCLKMYCQCFHLQIFCNENCNCVGCGNMQPTHDHKQAVIQALTRNPKAFQQQNPINESQFKLQVGLDQVKKGCRCKKTKCKKKYCQCYSTGKLCSLFCKCQDCSNCL